MEELKAKVESLARSSRKPGVGRGAAAGLSAEQHAGTADRIDGNSQR
jgi:hypothetical protein